jgi:signal transduction histidine kinase
VQEVYQAFKFEADHKDISLSCTNGAGVTIVEIDAGMMERVLQNLAGQRRQVHAGRRQRRHSHGRIRPAGRGFGGRHRPGIAPDVLPYIFDRYYRRAGNPPSAPPGGMGLGLVIVKKILELHGSQIMVETGPDTGTRFWFTLPTVGG